MWLIEQSILFMLERLYMSDLSPTADQQLQFDARINADSVENRLLTIAGETAQIGISGVLTKAPDFFAQFFGGGNTTYAEIIGAIAAAEMDDNVKTIDILVDSPGGQISGLFEAMDALASTTKPTRALVSDLAASAAYGLASQADEIVATQSAARVGSVGIVVSQMNNPNETIITSTNAPNKVPDATTEQGRAVIRAQLDDVENEFIGAIAAGRNLTADQVKQDFGKGGLVMAAEAVKRGMLDGIRATESNQNTTPPSGTTQDEEATVMNLDELKAKHPALYAIIFNEGKAAGEAAERARVSDHLLLADASGDTELAVKSIKEGASIASVSAAHQAAGIKKGIAAATAGDQGDLEAADGAAITPPAAPDAAAVAKTKEDEEAAALIAAELGAEGSEKILID